MALIYSCDAEECKLCDGGDIGCCDDGVLVLIMMVVMVVILVAVVIVAVFKEVQVL